MKKILLILAFLVSTPHIASSQVMFAKPDGVSIWETIPKGYRVFPLPVETYQLKGVGKETRLDIFATFSKKEKISALLATMKDAQKGETLGTMPLVLKTDGDEEFATVLLLQNVKVLYSPPVSTISGDYSWREYKQTEGASAVSDEKKASSSSIAIVRLLLTPKDAQLAAYAVTTNMRFSLVVRDINDTELSVLSPIDISAYTKEKQ